VGGKGVRDGGDKEEVGSDWQEILSENPKGKYQYLRVHPEILSKKPSVDPRTWSLESKVLKTAQTGHRTRSPKKTPILFGQEILEGG